MTRLTPDMSLLTSITGEFPGMYRHGRALAPKPIDDVHSARTYSLDAAANLDGGQSSAAAPVFEAMEWPDLAELPVGDPSKRFFDIGVAAAGLIVALPIMVLVAIAVKLTSVGPALHWSMREGFRGERFLMPKFRTMVEHAPIAPRELMDDADAHLTSIGSFLRASGLDELPQLYSILIGKMSLIGPRPLLPSDPAMVQRRRMRTAMNARPGITGLAQVNGRNAVSPRRKARYDTFYVSKWTWGLDISILAQTVKIVFSRRGFL